MSTRAHTAMLWFFAALAVLGFPLVVHAAMYAANAGYVVIAAGPVAMSGTLATLSWYARKETRAERGRTELAAANKREDHISRAS